MIFSKIALAQGLYYFITGIWPLLHMKSFLKVTGPKVDLWLVNCVGAIIAASGAALILAAFESEPQRAMVALAVGQAVALAAIDFYYSLRGRISKIYMADGFVQVGIILTWLFSYNA